jgi:hypothetical protein
MWLSTRPAAKPQCPAVAGWHYQTQMFSWFNPRLSIEKVVVDRTLVYGREPDDISAFYRTIVDVLSSNVFDTS